MTMSPSLERISLLASSSGLGASSRAVSSCATSRRQTSGSARYSSTPRSAMSLSTQSREAAVERLAIMKAAPPEETELSVTIARE